MFYHLEGHLSAPSNHAVNQLTLCKFTLLGPALNASKTDSVHSDFWRGNLFHDCMLHDFNQIAHCSVGVS